MFGSKPPKKTTHFFQGSRCFLLPFTQLNQLWCTQKVGPDSKVATLGIEDDR
jgi:hypothetical protein